MQLIEKAKILALHKHSGQRYGELPYSYHLVRVSSVLVDFGYADDESLMAAAWLHDAIEDTDATYEMLMGQFGNEVADIVWAVTNEPGGNRADRLRKTAQKIKANSKALILKLADRIANTEFNRVENPKLYQMYVKELELFHRLLYDPKDAALLPMWERLSKSSKTSIDELLRYWESIYDEDEVFETSVLSQKVLTRDRTHLTARFMADIGTYTAISEYPKPRDE